MERRTFVKRLTAASAGSWMIAGNPINLLAGNSPLKQLAASATNDNVLVFVQLHGGNDGLNTLIPISQYSEYYQLRPNLAINQTGKRAYIDIDASLPDEQRAGLHPDMIGFKTLYDQGKGTVVQNVGYEHMNLSHFRGRDIVFMGGGSDDNFGSGWMGRFLDYEYPGYPNDYPNESMPDPIGLEFSGNMSLSFHRENGIPIGFNIQNPEQFYNLINNVGVEPPIAFPESHAGDELRYLMEFEKKSNQYAGRLKEVYDAGSNALTVDYPSTYPLSAPERFISNPLTGQLRLIARLLKGGIKTRIFLCRMGLFDTHAGQVESYDSSLGGHAALLYHLSASIKAFQDDLAALGLEDRVLTMTFTEFGRRAQANKSFGTDHGMSTPVFLFGKKLKGGVLGQNPSLKPEDMINGNTVPTTDYRQIYTSVVQDWFGASDEALKATYFYEFKDKKLDLIEGVSSLRASAIRSGEVKLFPNPTSDVLNISFYVENTGSYGVYVIDSAGKRRRTLFEGSQQAGSMEVRTSVTDLPKGMYWVQIIGKDARANAEFIKL